jgi:hypothetical protein
VTEGWERFAADQRKSKTFDLSRIYDPYPFQSSFHTSTAPYGFLGGAAGPGKTMCMLMEQFTACNEFNADDGPKVHTILFRRTFPMLDATVITRFRETFPKELYKQFNATKNFVTWRNGSTTHFGSMQYEYDVWGWQGQWFHIGYDELCEFTFKQWMGTSAWNRCPVSKHCRKYGAGNPIGIGAIWVEDVFVKGVPCTGMDEAQSAAYDPADYEYFPATYLDNPIYANDPNWLKNLDAYPADVRDALKKGIWGAAGGYFRGVWDENEHVYQHGSIELPSWWKRWISGNWGYSDPASYYKHCMGDSGEVYTYDELYTDHEDPENLAEHIAEWALEDGEMPHFVNFTHSFDANATKRTATMGADPRSVNERMRPILQRSGIPFPLASTHDKLGRDTLMRELLAKRIKTGEDAGGHAIEVPGWMISDRCTHLRRLIPVVKADEKAVEKIENPGSGYDSPLQGAGYGLYAIFGRPAGKPLEVQAQEYYRSLSPRADNTAKSILMKKWRHEHTQRRGSPWASRQ